MSTQPLAWDPAKYGQFGDFRGRPFFDLTGRIAAPAPRTVVDLGCGPGNLTATLAQRWPGAQVVGVDSSPEMIGAARAAAHPGAVRFEQADLRSWRPGPDTDVVVSNAALQWVPGHEQLLGRWLAELPAGAWLAVQVPDNFAAPSHVLMRELAESPRWRGRLAGVLRHDDAVATPARYLELLLAAGAQADVWESRYSHLLQGPDPVLNWVRGTGLRPVLQALDAAEAAAFEREYAQALRRAYPATAHGTVFEFRRLFMVAQKLAEAPASTTIKLDAREAPPGSEEAKRE